MNAEQRTNFFTPTNRDMTVDIETVFGRGQAGKQHMFAFAYKRYGEDPKELRWRPDQKVLNEASHSALSYWNRYASEHKNITASNKNIGNDIYNVMFDKQGRRTWDSLTVYNPNFDIRHILGNFDETQSKHFLKQFGAESFEGLDLDMGMPRYGTGAQKLSARNNYIMRSKYEEMAFINDPLGHARALMQTAHERKLVDYGDDLFTGTKLSFFMDARNVATKSHMGTADTESTESLSKWFSDVLEPQLLDENTAPTQEVMDFLNYPLEVRKAGFNKKMGGKGKGVSYTDKIRQRDMVGFASEYAETGEITFSVKNKMRRYGLDESNPDVLPISSFFPDIKHETEQWSNYNKSAEDLKKNFDGFKDELLREFSSGGYEGLRKAEGRLLERIGGDEASIIKSIGKNRLSRTGGVLEAVPKKTYKAAPWIIGGVAAMWTITNIIPSDRNHYNTIPGLADKGIAGSQRHENTDFGSPLQMEAGFSKAFKWIKKLGVDVGTEFWKSLKQYKGYAITTSLPGMYEGYQKGKDEGSVSPGRFAGRMAIDMSDDVLVFGAPTLVEKSKTLKSMEQFLSHPLAKKVGIGFFGYTVGSLIGEMAAQVNFPNKYNHALNPKSGLPEDGVAAYLRHRDTDFGSPLNMTGGISKANNEDSDINSAQDVYKYDFMRASKIGASESDMYKYMTEEQKEISPFVTASANAGTALHQLMQAQAYQKGEAYDTEKLAYNPEHNISGHIDLITDAGIGDIKTVSGGIFNAIAKSGAPKPMHKAQVQFYMGATGIDEGYLQYVNRDKPYQQKFFQVAFDPYFYERELRKVERVRGRVKDNIKSGKLLESNMPKTASIERLRQAEDDRTPPEDQVANISEYAAEFNTRMQMLRETKRGMPTSGAGYNRIQDARKKKREQAMQTTQGIGLVIWNNRIGHHIM